MPDDHVESIVNSFVALPADHLAVDPDSADCPRQTRYLPDDGSSIRSAVSYSGEHRHGGRNYADHWNSVTVAELWRLVGHGNVYASGLDYQCSHAKVCELVMESSFLQKNVTQAASKPGLESL